MRILMLTLAALSLSFFNFDADAAPKEKTRCSKKLGCETGTFSKNPIPGKDCKIAGKQKKYFCK